MHRFFILAAIIAVLGAQAGAPNFRLTDHVDRSQELYRLDGAKVVLLIAHDLNDATLETDLAALMQMQGKMDEYGAKIWLVNANPKDTREGLRDTAKRLSLPYPILKDDAQSVSRALGFKYSGEVLVILPGEDWKFAARLPAVSALGQGVEAVLSAAPATTAIGGAQEIAYRNGAELSYSKDIAPILQARCVSCHQDGGIGPFTMGSHKKVAGWADMIEEALLTKQMPPWHADPQYGHFKNSTALKVEEEQKLVAWLDAGAPILDGEVDPLSLGSATEVSKWFLGEPGAVVQLPEPVTLPATGVIDYQYINVPSGLTEDKWLKGIEVKPTSPAVVHHALIFVIYPPQYEHLQPDAKHGLNGYFASYLPGAKLHFFPEGTGQFLPAGTTFVFQMHYSTTGKKEVDQTEMALYFCDEEPKDALYIRGIAETDLFIAPGEQDVPMEKSRTLDDPMTLWGLSPHMHFRGSRFRFTAEYPEDKGSETLLNVPWYQFDWQPMYLLDGPVNIPAGTRIRCEGAFDNSKYNARNPDPAQWVHFGEQSYDEMFIGYLMYSQPRDAEKFSKREVAPEELIPITTETLKDTKWGAGGGFRIQFNADGTVLSPWFAGKWRIEGTNLIVAAGGRDMKAEIVGSDLYYEGRKLRRVRGDGEYRGGERRRRDGDERRDE